MASPYTQDKRIGSLDTPLGDNALDVVAFHGVEGMSECFEFVVDAVSPNKSQIAFDKAIGKNCTLKLKTLDGDDRHFDGILTEVRSIAADGQGVTYRLLLRPWLWVLSKRVNSKIFANKTAPDIIEEVFGDHSGLAKFDPVCSKSYPTREYTAQYRESDMDFVCRLMEEEGIYYYFRHAPGVHTLVMGDSVSSNPTVEKDSRSFVAVQNIHRRETEYLHTWNTDRQFTIGKIALKDYNFETPTTNLLKEKTGDAAYDNGKLEAFDYPGKYAKPPEGEHYAGARMDMERAKDFHFFGEGDCGSLYPGALMTLKDHPDGEQNRQYVVLRCQHALSGQRYRSGTGADGGGDYSGTYEFARADKPYCPPIVTPKPYIRGPQTAKVVGSGEIDCDEYGRILVQFHWDRKPDKSRRVRVAQVWAGKNWGAMFTPRVDMEVVVDFLEGDPDQPLVVGCVYNKDNMPPFKLKDKKNIAGWKSNSTTGGGGYNELSMDDTSGSEKVQFHGQKDLDAVVENNETREVKQERKTKIGHKDTLDVGDELLIKAGQKITIKVGESSITMDMMSITIESPTVEVKSKLLFKTKSEMLSTHEAVGVFTINGLMVKIN